MAKNAEETDKSQRLDKWLWAARFYKTRSLAVEAINGGKVHLNNNRVKPSRTIKLEDTISISKPPYEFVISVLGLSNKRGPATEAQNCIKNQPKANKSVSYYESKSKMNR
jgi:ribosome-associated heat shock protein Hsp15